MRRTGVFSGGFRLQKTTGKDPWTIEKLPIGPLSMVPAKDTIVLAGFVDAIDPADPWARIEGRKDSVLWILSQKDGKTFARYGPETLPVWNGMAAGNSRIFISLKNGTLACLGQ